MSLRQNTEFPEHEKLLGEVELREALDRIFAWMAKQGRTLKGEGTDRVAICKLQPASITEKVYCDECEGTGKDISQLTSRQTQVLRHVRALREAAPLSFKKAERDEQKDALAELEVFSDELEQCGTCYGEGETTTYRRGDPEWRPVYSSPKDFLMDMLAIDKNAFRLETKELFDQLRRQADQRPRDATTEERSERAVDPG